jgi:uncharacterized membrane protein YcaP (DUF421 family)
MDLVFRAAVLFFAVFVLLRVIDRRELAEMEPFDFILLIVLGDAIQQGLTQDDYSVTGAVIAVATIAALQVLTSWLAFRSRRARRVIEGEPIVLVQDGKLIEKNLHRERMTADDVAEEMRMNEIASFDEVGWAILESNGTMSFVKK